MPASSEDDEVVAYYDRIAHCYDADRFGTSYGRNVDAQERPLIRMWTAPTGEGRILDLGCGSGRFLDMATHGIDPSRAMVDVARANHPGRTVLCGDIHDVVHSGERFDAIICMHVMMHLPESTIAGIIDACGHVLRPGGRLIFDAPSLVRRRLLRRKQRGWHGATALHPRRLKTQLASGWRLLDHRGILFTPAHRVPERVRPLLRHIDRAIGAGPLRTLSSYILYCFERVG